MSRIGKQEILIPTGVKVTQSASSFGNTVTVAGPKGTLSKVFKDDITIAITDPAKDGAGKAVNLNIKRNDKFSKSLVKGKELHFALGFSHPVIVSIPAGITATAEKNIITISGADKELVGSFTAAIRALKKPEPYKGKGMRYEGEVIRRKQGKKTA